MRKRDCSGRCAVFEKGEIRHYLKQHPHAAVVELGAGLSCLRRQMKNETNPWYCLDMDNVIPLREKYIPLGKYEQNIACDLNDFAWFDKVDFHATDGIIFTAGGLFYYFEKEQVRRLLCAMAKRFPGGMITFDAVNAVGLEGGWRKTILTRVFAWVMRTFHMSFMLHVEFCKMP